MVMLGNDGGRGAGGGSHDAGGSRERPLASERGG